MLKFFKMTTDTPPRSIGHWFLADSTGQAAAWMNGICPIKYAGVATQDELAHWMALCENDEPLDYMTWQKVTEVPPPVNHPIWTKQVFNGQDTGYACFTFNNLDDCQGCGNLWWLPIAGHDYGISSQDLADMSDPPTMNDDPELKRIGSTPLSRDQLSQTFDSPSKHREWQWPALLNPPAFKLGDLVTFEWSLGKSVPPTSGEVVGVPLDTDLYTIRYHTPNGPAQIELLESSLTSVPPKPPTFQNKSGSQWPLKLNQWVTFSKDGKTYRGQIVAPVMGAEPDMVTVEYDADGKGSYQELDVSAYCLTAALKHSVGQKVCFYSEGVRVEGVVFMLEKPIGLGLPFYIIKTSNGRRFEVYEEGLEARE